MNKNLRTLARIVALLGTFLALYTYSTPRSWAEPLQLEALVNADFEAGFSVRESQEVEVAVGWDYSYLAGDDRWCPAPCHRPEWKPETEIVVSGYAQRWFSTFSRHYAVIHQGVNVQAGRWYEFSCQVYGISEPDGQLAVRVGANPWGVGVDDHTMLWGRQQPWGQYREWHTVSVVFQAFGDHVRVGVGSVPAWPTKNNAAYVDNCTFKRIEMGGECPECPECPPGTCDVETLKAALLEVLRGLEWVVGD